MVPESKPNTTGSKSLHDLTSLSSTSLPHSRWPSSLNYSCFTDLALADAFPGNAVHLGVFRIVSFKKKKFRSQFKYTSSIARTSLTTQLNYSKLLVYISLLYTQCLEWCLAHSMCSVWPDGIDYISYFSRLTCSCLLDLSYIVSGQSTWSHFLPSNSNLMHISFWSQIKAHPLWEAFHTLALSARIISPSR